MLSVIFTIIMFVVLLYGLLKNWHATTWMLLVSLGFGFIWTLISGRSILTDAGSGNAFVDLFETIQNSAIYQFTSVILCIGACMGYIAYIDQMKAPARFTEFIAAPLKRLNKPYLVCSLAFLVSALVKFVIPAPASVMAMLLVTLYPIMRSLGISSATAACSIIIGSTLPWGPSNSFIYVAFANAGMDSTNVTSWSVTTQMMYMIPVIIVSMFTIPLTSWFFDRHEKQTASTLEAKEMEDLSDVPLIYIILPLMPLIVLLFFTFVLKVNISLVASLFISLLIAMVFWIVLGKEKVDIVTVFARFNPMYKATGDFLGSTGFLLIASNCFATVISSVGGLNYIVDLAISAEIPITFLLLLLTLIVMVLIGLTSSTMAMIPVFAPIFASIAQIAGLDPYEVINLLLLSISASGALGLAYMCNVIAAPTMGVKVTTLIKRNVIPVVAICLSGYLLTVFRCL